MQKEYNRDYILNYGNVTFDEIPFNEADNISICQMFYMPIEKAAPEGFDTEPENYGRVANRMFALNGGKHRPAGLVLTKETSVKMMLMANTRRFSEMKIGHCVSVFKKEPATQFNAATLLLPTGEIVVIFRGTDDTLIGWKEDLDIYTRKGMASIPLAKEYLENVCKKYPEGDIIVIGHSKGGHVALYGALACDKEIRDRITELYNNDGPGDWNYDFLDTDAYKELLPKYRHFIPQSSLVGILLCHDNDYTVVQSKFHLGPLQHDPGSWQLDGKAFVTRDGLTRLGRINDIAFNKIFLGIEDKKAVAFDKIVADIVEGTKCHGLMDVAKNVPGAVIGGIKAWRNEDKAVKEDFHGAFKGSLGKIIAAVKESK